MKHVCEEPGCIGGHHRTKLHFDWQHEYKALREAALAREREWSVLIDEGRALLTLGQEEVEQLAAKVQYLVDYMHKCGYLEEDGAFMFPDGDLWQAGPLLLWRGGYQRPPQRWCDGSEGEEA